MFNSRHDTRNLGFEWRSHNTGTMACRRPCLGLGTCETTGADFAKPDSPRQGELDWPEVLQCN